MAKQRADEHLAIDTLMVTDTLFKSCDLATRLQYVALTESVKEHGGTVRVFSSLHVSGESLAQVSGIAALLRFPMPEEQIVAPGDDGAGGNDDDDGADAFGGGGVNMVFSLSAKGVHHAPIGGASDDFDDGFGM